MRPNFYRGPNAEPMSTFFYATATNQIHGLRPKSLERRSRPQANASFSSQQAKLHPHAFAHNQAAPADLQLSYGAVVVKNLGYMIELWLLSYSAIATDRLFARLPAGTRAA